MVTLTYFILGALIIGVVILLRVFLNIASRIKTIENSLLVDEYKTKENNDTIYRTIESLNSDSVLRAESIISEYTKNHIEVNSLIDSREKEASIYYNNLIKELDIKINNRYDEVIRLIDSRVDKLDAKLEKTTNKTYFDFNNLLSESVLKEVNSVKEGLS